MLIPRLVTATLLIGLMVLSAGVASGQDYPSKPIHIITSEPGGNGDFHARVIAQGLTSVMGQPVVVDNRNGTIIPAQAVANAPPDGYTLFGIGSAFWFGPLLQKTPYDPVRDFSPITLTTSSPNVLVVHPSLPVRSVRELIALAKARPGELNYASAGTGGAAHLAAELFKSMAGGINIVRIPYKGGATLVNAMLSGEVQLSFSTAPAVGPHLKSGRLKALAVTSARPSALFPGLPTVAATGLPGYESVGMTGVFAPANTSVAIIKRLNQEIVLVLGRADVKDKCAYIGVEVVGSSPEELAAAMKSEMARMGKVIKDAGIKAE